LRQQHRDSIAQLAHGFGPTAVKHKTIWEGLQACAFAHRKITHTAVIADQHVFPARNSVIAGFEGFGRSIQRTSGVSRIHFGPILKLVIENIPGDV